MIKNNSMIINSYASEIGKVEEKLKIEKPAEFMLEQANKYRNSFYWWCLAIVLLAIFLIILFVINYFFIFIIHFKNF